MEALIRFFSVLFIFVLYSWVVCAQALLSEDMNLYADEMTQKEGILHLKGNVKVKLGTYRLAADRAEIFWDEKRVVAHGGIVLQGEGHYVEAAKIDFNYQEEIGDFYNAFIRSGQVTLEGGVIRKVGENKYKVVDAKFSTCIDCPHLWSLTGQLIEAEIGGYAYIKQPMLRIKNFPAFWLPVIWVPLKSERESGLLVPLIEQGSSLGGAINLSYFWSISRSQDMTFSTKLYTKNRSKGLLEYRHIFNENGRGQFNGGVLIEPGSARVDSFDSGLSPAVRREESGLKMDRGFISYRYYYPMANHIVQRASFNYTSDTKYRKNFPEDFIFKTYNSDTGQYQAEPFDLGIPALENSVSLTRSRGNEFVSLEGTFYINQLQEEYQAKSEDSVQRLPEVYYSMMEREMGDSGVMFTFDTRYTRFTRSGLPYDNVCNNISCLDGKSVDFRGGINSSSLGLQERRVDTQRDGEFDPSKDLIRSGHRLILGPRFSYPLFLGEDKLKAVPSFRYNHNFYHFGPVADLNSTTLPEGPTLRAEEAFYKKSVNRSYWELNLDLSTQLSRVFGGGITEWEEGKKGRGYKHEIEPRLTYIRSIPQGGDGHSFWGASESRYFQGELRTLTDFDFLSDRGVQFDYFDQTLEKNRVYLGVDSRVMSRNFQEGEATYLEVLSMRVQQSYNFGQSGRESSQPWGSLDSLLKVRWGPVEWYGSGYYYPYAGTAKVSSRFRLRSKRGSFLELSYSIDPKVDENNEYDFENRNETGALGLGLTQKYLSLSGELGYSLKEESIQYWTVVARLELPGDCLYLQTSLSQLPGPEGLRASYSMVFNF